MFKDLHSSAIALYDGGWRSEDKDQFTSVYNLSESEAEQLYNELKRIEDEINKEATK